MSFFRRKKKNYFYSQIKISVFFSKDGFVISFLSSMIDFITIDSIWVDQITLMIDHVEYDNFCLSLFMLKIEQKHEYVRCLLRYGSAF
jgi:hypothetical protein